MWNFKSGSGQRSLAECCEYGDEQHAYEEGHKICLNEAEVLQIEPNTTDRKYKDFTHLSVIDHSISQPSLDISPMWTRLSQQKSRNYNSVQCRVEWGNLFFLCWYHKEYFISPVLFSI
jgi:hypothetical protein